MLYGTVLRAPVEGSVPNRIDDARAKAVPGVTAVIRLPHGVGVVAQTAWAAFSARQALIDSVTWTRTGTAWGFDSDKGHDAFAADAKNLSQPARDWSAQGNARGAFQNAASTIEGEYRCDYAYHAQMEPLNAVAFGRSGRRCRRNLGRDAKSDHGLGSARQVPRHLARQGDAARSSDGRRLRPARQSRCRFHHGCRDAVEGGQSSSQSDVDARG